MFHTNSASRGARSDYTPYDHPHYESKHCLDFAHDKDWDKRWPTERLRTGILAIRFGSRFNIKERAPSPSLPSSTRQLILSLRSTQMTALATSPEAFRSSILCITSGDTDTGIGSSLQDPPIIALAAAIPSLHSISLESAVDITNAAIIAIIRSCADIMYLSVCGNDKSTGSVTFRPLQDVLGNKGTASKLTHLHLEDQRLDLDMFKSVSRARPQLAIIEGRTDGDGIAAQMVIARGGEGLLMYGWEVRRWTTPTPMRISMS
jgi:hypothetical protein